MQKLQLCFKRTIDVVISLLAIIFSFPLFMVIAILIKMTSHGPVFFRQVRVGKDNNNFGILKFRTMVVGAHLVKDGLAVSSGDSRITTLGKFLRKTSLDELPQFINVLKGDLSLVGPRPGLPEQLKYFSQEQMSRTKMRPGITGLATVNGRASIPWSKRIEYDLQYIKEFNLLLDIKILIKTLDVVLTGKNTYYDHSNGPAFDLAAPDDLPQAYNDNTEVKDGNS